MYEGLTHVTDELKQSSGVLDEKLILNSKNGEAVATAVLEMCGRVSQCEPTSEPMWRMLSVCSC